MGHALIWVETLTAALAAVALVTGWAARRSGRRVRWLVAGGVAATLLGAATVATVFVARLPGAGGSYPTWFAASWTVALAGGVLIILSRGLWNADEAGGPAGRAWNLGRLAAVAAVAAALDVMTMSNLDLAQKIVLTRERAEAGARVVTLLPPPVADRDNAAPVYRDAFALLRARDAESTRLLAKWLLRTDTVDPHDRELTEFLRGREPGLALLRKAAGMPGCRFELDYLGPVREWGGDTGAILSAARVLALDARVRAGRGEPGPALADVAALYGMARHMDEPAVLTVLLAAALDTLAGGALVDVLDRTFPTPDDLAVVRPGDVSHQRALRRAAVMGDAAGGPLGILAALDARPATGYWEAVRQQGLEGASRSWFAESAAYRVFFLADDLAAHRENTRAALALLARPYWEARGEWDTLEKSAAGRGGLLAPWRGSWGPYAYGAAVTDARHQLARLALAAASYRAATGSLPEGVEALVPAYLEAVPPDPFSGAPLRSRRDGKTLVVFSVGPNGQDGASPVRSERLEVRLTDR